MILTHYTDKIITSVHSMAQKDKPYQFKPQGFWVSVDGQHDWKAFCVGEDWNTERLVNRYRVVLNEPNEILIIRTPEALLEFTDKYRATDGTGMFDQWINWVEVAKRYPGIIISPYQFSLRLDPRVHWYYGWDCASGCIWDSKVISDIHIIKQKVIS
jgi:hypothetical protein